MIYLSGGRIVGEGMANLEDRLRVLPSQGELIESKRKLLEQFVSDHQGIFPPQIGCEEPTSLITI